MDDDWKKEARVELLQLLYHFSELATWQTVAHQVEKRQKEQADASECHRIAGEPREYDNPEVHGETWRGYANTHEKHGETYRLLINETGTKYERARWITAHLHPELAGRLPPIHFHSLPHPDATEMATKAFELAAIVRAQATVENQNGQAPPPKSANETQIFPKGEPPDTDFVDFVMHMKRTAGNGESQNARARKFTGEPKSAFPIANSYLTRLRKAVKDGIVSP
jgi:hypothetical protein